jgi:hypothetical protein
VSYELWGAGGGRGVGGRTFDSSTRSATSTKLSINSLRAGKAQCKEDQDKFFVFSWTIATILYKYMHIYLWTALRIRDLRMMDLRINGF